MPGHPGDGILFGGTLYLWVLASCHLSGALHFVVVPRFLENLWTPSFMNTVTSLWTEQWRNKFQVVNVC